MKAGSEPEVTHHMTGHSRHFPFPLIKYILAATILFTSITATLADEQPKRFVQLDEKEVIQQALKYVKALNPAEDLQKLVYQGTQFQCWARPAGYNQKNADGSTQFVKVADADEHLRATLKCSAVRKWWPRVGATASSIKLST